MERRKKSSLIGKFQQFKFSRRMGSRNVIARWINLKLLVFLPAATISFLFYFLFFEILFLFLLFIIYLLAFVAGQTAVNNPIKTCWLLLGQLSTMSTHKYNEGNPWLGMDHFSVLIFFHKKILLLQRWSDDESKMTNHRRERWPNVWRTYTCQYIYVCVYTQFIYSVIIIE